MTRYPYDADKNRVREFNDESDLVIHWRVEDEFLPDHMPHSSWALRGKLRSADYDGEELVVRANLAGAIDHIPADPDIRNRLHEVAQALVDGKSVTIEGEG